MLFISTAQGSCGDASLLPAGVRALCAPVQPGPVALLGQAQPDHVQPSVARAIARRILLLFQPASHPDTAAAGNQDVLSVGRGDNEKMEEEEEKHSFTFLFQMLGARMEELMEAEQQSQSAVSMVTDEFKQRQLLMEDEEEDFLDEGMAAVFASLVKRVPAFCRNFPFAIVAKLLACSLWPLFQESCASQLWLL